MCPRMLEALNLRVGGRCAVADHADEGGVVVGLQGDGLVGLVQGCGELVGELSAVFLQGVVDRQEVLGEVVK